MSSLIAHNTEPELRSSTQGFLQGIHHGFGKFCGAVFGGMLIKEHGKIITIENCRFRYLSYKITIEYDTYE